VLGALIITVLPEMLRGFADFRTMINGAILVIIVLFLPKGLWDPQRLRQLFRMGAR
jgi:branched-chain amino acid transport system permease protein